MSNVSQSRMQMHALGAAVAVALSSMVAGSAFAANRVDLHGLNLQQVNSLKTAGVAKVRAGVARTSDRHAQMLGLDRESRLLELNRTRTRSGAQNFRYQQSFRGIPIFGEHVIISEKDGAVRLLYGNMITGLASELPATSPRLAKTQALAIAKRASLGSRLVSMQTQNEKTRQMIYIDANGRANMSYLVSFFADKARGGTPTRPHVIVDANTGKILKQWEGLTTDLIGTGPGGNTKTGQYEYGSDFGFNDVAVSGSNCTMNNTNVKSVNLNHGTTGSTAYMYTPCPRNTFKAINGAFSPINDAHYFGDVVFDMFNAYVGTPPLTFQLTMRVHYSNNYENAFWDGSAMTFGDGASTFYPLVSLDVSAHEVSHGYTEQNSGLIYDNQSGGMNEAFSDISGEAAEFFSRGTNDFLVGAEIFKAPAGALRYMYDPPLDGVSIDNIADYNDSIDVHYSSGIYNKAFWKLATTMGWTSETAFQVFAFANRDYWIPDETMLAGSCKVEQSAADALLNVADVQAAFAVVGLDCADPGEPVAAFTWVRTDLTVDFTDGSTDSDGTIVSRVWDFGDGSPTSTATNPSHTYAVSGVYDVTLTVTDNDAITDVETQAVSLLGGVLENGVPVTGIGGATGSEIHYELAVPAGATGLDFVMSGGTGDGDLYVRFGAPPTTALWDCRPYTGGNNETCVVADVDIQVGTYYVMIRGFTTYSGASLVGSYDTGGPGTCDDGGVLSDGVPKIDIACDAGSSQFFTMVVPADATNLSFKATGGTGNYVVYTKLGSPPSTSDYDCKQGRTKAKPCSLAAPVAGTYHVMIYGASAYAGVTLVGNYDCVGCVQTQTYTNTTDFPITDNATVESPITVAGRSGNAPVNASVTVAILHTWIGDLLVELVAPDGTAYVLHNRTGGSADNINATYEVDLSSETLNGEWKLRVNDNASGDTGNIDSWSVTF